MTAIPKCTLVPARYFDAAEPAKLLSEVAVLDKGDKVGYVGVPAFDAVLVYAASDGNIPLLCTVLERIGECREYNKILAAWQDGCLSLAIAQGKNLLLSNVFTAPDFTTAEYFVFASLKALQLNPEMSTICFLTPLGADDEMSLYRYFRAVEQLGKD